MERTDSKEYLLYSFSSSNVMSWVGHKGNGKRITSTDLKKVLMSFHVVPRKEKEGLGLKNLKSEILLKSHLLSQEAFKCVSDWMLGSHPCTEQPQLLQKSLRIRSMNNLQNLFLLPSKGRITTDLPEISSRNQVSPAPTKVGGRPFPVSTAEVRGIHKPKKWRGRWMMLDLYTPV